MDWAVFKQPTPPKPPKKVPKETRALGRVRIDEFDWMSNKNDPDLVEYIQAENTYAHEYFAGEVAAIHLLNREMKQVLRTKKVTAPLTTVVRGYEYYTKTSRHGMIYCRRRKTSSLAKEEILLDSAYLPDNCTVKKVLLSTAHHIFSFLTLEDGEELGSLHFRDLDREEPFEEVLEGVFNFVWGNDNKTVYYTKSTDVLRPYQVWAHQVGTGQESDILVFQEDDDSIFVDVGSTKDQQFVTINGNSLSSSEVRILDAGHDFSTGELPELKTVAPRVEGVEYYVDHHDDHYYILTNDNPKKNFRVMRASRNASRDSWVELMEAKDGEKIEDVDIFKNYMVIYAKRDALPVISCYHFETGAIHEVPLPEQFCTIGAGVNLDYETDSFQFTLNSPYAHEATYEYDMASRVMTALRVHPIHRLDRSKYTCTRINVTAADGEAKIPVTLLHRKNMQLNGRNPTLMRAYGAYGVPTDIDFRVEHFPLLERGWIIALAHVRGGSELGTLWYHQGKLDKKRNTFTDFIDVAEHLVEAGYTNPRRLTASGVSAGGLLMGAVCNMRPDLFRAMILNVPFLDPMTTMLDPEIPLTKVEYLEWGNPAESEKMYDYMASYAPYDAIPDYNNNTHNRNGDTNNDNNNNNNNLQQGNTTDEDKMIQSSTTSSLETTYPSPPITARRPALMISCGERDQRVDFTQSAKFVARLRSRLEPWYGAEGKEACVLMVDENRGHFGNGSQDDRVKNWAREVVFLLGNVQQMDMGGSNMNIGHNNHDTIHRQK
ncbi:hypothetical protein BGZ46_007057 [Entomortierella lignicola]|nr:hypothetical protein BGZ46_007057 [Entomortierella lignicola]